MGSTRGVMAALNKRVIGLMTWQGRRFLPSARRYHNAHVEGPLALLLGCPI